MKILSNIALKAGPREVGESGCVVRMVDRTLIQNELEVLHSIVQVSDILACRIIGKQCVTCVCALSNLAVNDGLQFAICQQEPNAQGIMSLTSSNKPSSFPQATFSVIEGWAPRMGGKERSATSE